MRVEVNTFLATAFPTNELDGGVVGVCEGIFRCVPHDSERTLAMVDGGEPTYVVVSTLDGRLRESTDGRVTSDLGRTRGNCKEAWLFVLDDIGTKSSTPLVEPSYKLCTSVKDDVENYQWGYFLEPFDVSTDAGVAFYEGACRAAGEAGISDPGMRGVYRICRVPGSLHSSGFRAEIRSWEPDRVFALKDLCELLGLDVESAIKPVPKQIRDEDYLGGPDVALDWLVAGGYTTGAINGDWVEIECPNAGAHTDGSVTAGYSPLDYRREGRQFKCFHGHCSHMDTAWFLGWMADMGGPAVGVTESFHMSEDARANIQKAIKTALPEVVVSEMVSGDEREQILKEWIFCSTRGVFFHYDGVNPPTQFVKPGAFNLMFQHLMPRGKRGGTITPDKWWSNREEKMTVSDLVWHPGRGQGIFVDDSGVLQFNQYRPYVPEGIGVDLSVNALWDRHLEILFGSEAGILRQWMAWLVQHPDQRIGWAPVLVGPEGCGKSILVKGLVACLGERYVAEVGPSAFTDAFNGHSEGKLLVVGEEIRVSGKSRYEILDSLKTRITNDRIDIRRMHQDRKTIINTASYLFCSNHDDCLPLDSSGRRWAVFNCAPQTAKGIAELGLDAAYFARLGDTIQKQAGAIYSWLFAVDVSAFDPKGRAPITAGTVEMIDSTTDESYESLLRMLESGSLSGANERVFINAAVASAANNLGIQSNRDVTKENRWKAYLKENGWVRFPESYYIFGVSRRGWYKKDLVPEEQRNGPCLGEILSTSGSKEGLGASVTDILSARRKS